MAKKKTWGGSVWSATKKGWETTKKGAETTKHYTLQTTTLGQYGSLKKAQEAYQNTYAEYEKATSSANNQINMNASLTERSGEYVLEIVALAENGADLLRTAYRDIQVDVNMPELVALMQRRAEIVEKIESVNSTISAVLDGAKGAGVGTAAAIGAWSVVTTFGVASTGTAISTLSGAALTNAGLAALGGGALQAGGFGMLGGTAVLGGVVALPLIAFSAYSTAKKSDEVKGETEKLNIKIAEANDINEEAARLTQGLRSKTKELQRARDKLQRAVKEVDSIVNKSKTHNVLQRFIRWLKKMPEYSDNEIREFEHLEKTINTILEHLFPEPTTEH